MPTAMMITIGYGSRLARHGHALWTSSALTGTAPQIPARDQARVLQIPVSSFDQTQAPLRFGRFYPSNLMRSPAAARAPVFRVIAREEELFTADFNHPLAGRTVYCVQEAENAPAAAAGRPEALFTWAGMEAPLDSGNTDFSDPEAFERDAGSDDAEFYATPRRVIHVDQTCASRITALYRRLLRSEDRVLDLMSSWRSHLPDLRGEVTGLGMNAEEMADNPQLHSHVVHDLNRDHTLPFEDGRFDAVVNTVSIEYLVRPRDVLRHVRRILRPGGLLIVSFSNRFFPPKTIQLWKQLHPVERLGWVLQCMHDADFRELETLAEYGLKRSPADRYAGQIEEADPLFAVWGRRTVSG